MFKDRRDAGRRLAACLSELSNLEDVVVLGLPRGGVVVAFEVARHLDAPLDVFIVRKLGVPGFEELAMGAIASGGIVVVNEDVVRAAGISRETFQMVAAREQEELARRERAYRGQRPGLEVRGRSVIVVDDGLATGASMQAAVEGLRRQDAARIIVAVPVAARATAEALRHSVDDLIAVYLTDYLDGIGSWYEDFRQTSDDEVRELLRMASQMLHQASPTSG